MTEPLVPRLLAENCGASVYHATWQALAAMVGARGGVDHLIVDAPYSEKTHAGHDGGAALASRANYSANNGGACAKYAGKAANRSINYAYWTDNDVDAFVDTWAPHVRGWWVSLTDHVLAPIWEAALRLNGLYAFSPIACVEPGSRVRMTGDGPAQWSCWAIVARPKGAPFSKWGALPGAYVVPPGGRGEWRGAYGGERVVGGKAPWLMERIVDDYSRPGDTIVDPCCGAGTTLRAAQATGRKAIGGDMLLEHAEIAARAISLPVQTGLFVA